MSFVFSDYLQTALPRAPLVVQWLAVCFAMQGTPLQTLVKEDPTGYGATKAVSRKAKVFCPRARAPQQEKPLEWKAHAPQLESSPCSLQLEKAYMRPWHIAQSETAKIHTAISLRNGFIPKGFVISFPLLRVNSKAKGKVSGLGLNVFASVYQPVYLWQFTKVSEFPFSNVLVTNLLEYTIIQSL